MSHTPGPWTRGEQFSSIVYDSDNMAVAHACGANLAIAEANAALIATAPDMLAMLKRFLASRRKGLKPFRCEIEALVDKAEKGGGE